MGLFDFVENSAKLVKNTAMLGVDVVKDVVDDEDRSDERIEEISQNMQDIEDSFFDIFD